MSSDLFPPQLHLVVHFTDLMTDCQININPSRPLTDVAKKGSETISFCCGTSKLNIWQFFIKISNEYQHDDFFLL
jgi:hypothetical protein